ncbi:MULTISPECIES: NAD(P)-dependent oxidoreductase [Acinetobacter]|uniref:NAD(P)-dependent oxidoreductase n=1 Tax=Acinetobacter faecalis TaxID=2665161 RepID=A0AB35USN4_9GAMM|nr:MULTISPECIES: NAD(P)-dependent oxidoreductase [Acinetobacter]MDY6459076.1 NAD(P)-dependent oxidoreductase [Acinetobacter faecalis]MDY6461483.1 NAD(P)-dependent oxidoreductase [Acinetobacter faecalis]MDY6483601.1 NAD(P)-dependent oxidoreductase [Acinetobacter faecalis]MDY6485727.1 NAD(P)-dependent oxidoreductase [Acinetobacter faecalis]MDY6509576.1 NAD(P)-dependent oxidoreductase [Acinetobacter faecalis]
MSFNLQTKIAFLGMGLMGSRMASRLLNAGFQVAVWNRTASACDELVAQGATKLNLNEIGQYPIVLTCLADDSAVQAVIDQIADYLQPQQVIVDFSSLSVDKTKSLAKQVQGKNAIWIDSPVSGGTMGAEQGSLVIFAGGDAHVIESLAIVYDVLSQRVTRMGETGTGQATKICNQLIVAANSTLIAEAVALASLSGVDTTLLAPALAGGFADSKPFQILAPRMATHTFEPVQWKVQTLSKDLNNAVKLAEQFNLDIPVAKRALSQLKDHQTQGFSEADLATVIQHVEPK